SDPVTTLRHSPRYAAAELAQLAAGAEGARETRDAREALERLTSRGNHISPTPVCQPLVGLLHRLIRQKLGTRMAPSIQGIHDVQHCLFISLTKVRLPSQLKHEPF